MSKMFAARRRALAEVAVAALVAGLRPAGEGLRFMPAMCEGTMLRFALLVWLLPGAAMGQVAPTPTAADLEKVKTVEAIDIAVSRADYVGQMVRIPRILIWKSEVSKALLSFPGATGEVSLEAMPRPQVRQLVETCGGMPQQNPASCTMTLIAVVSDEVGWMKGPVLVGVSIEPSAPSPTRRR